MAETLTNTSSGLANAWHPVLKIDELGTAPVRVLLLGEPYVVARMNGLVRAFVDKCPHRNARLSDGSIVNDNIECPYHGWRFGGSGSCSLIPALGAKATIPPNARLTSVQVTEKYDLVWLAPQPPVCEILEVAEWDDPNLRRVWMPPIDINASAAQFIDNFLDYSHFPFVHSKTFGSMADVLIDEYQVERSDWSFVVHFEHQIANKEDPKVESGEHPLVQPRIMHYEYGAAFSANLRLELPMTGMVNALASFCQPIDKGTSRLFMVMLRNDISNAQQHQEAVEYEMEIFAEDRKIIENLYNKEIPLNLGQVHTRVDRNTVEFRRIMTKLLSS